MFRPKPSAQTKFPEDTTEPEKNRRAEPASIVKRRRFCRRTSLHFNKVCKNRFGKWPWRLTFRRHRRCANRNRCRRAQDTDRDLRIQQGFIPNYTFGVPGRTQRRK